MIMPLFNLEKNPIMTFIVQQNIDFFNIGNGLNRVGFISAIIVLLLNYFGWWLCFNGHQSIGIIMFFLVVLPPLYYVCIAAWRQNWVLFITGIIFGVVHFVHVLGNLKIS